MIQKNCLILKTDEGDPNGQTRLKLFVRRVTAVNGESTNSTCSGRYFITAEIAL